MSKRIYNLTYAVYFLCIGADKEYEDAAPGQYEQYAAEMLGQMQEFLTIKKGVEGW